MSDEQEPDLEPGADEDLLPDDDDDDDDNDDG